MFLSCGQKGLGVERPFTPIDDGMAGTAFNAFAFHIWRLLSWVSQEETGWLQPFHGTLQFPDVGFFDGLPSLVTADRALPAVAS